MGTTISSLISARVIMHFGTNMVTLSLKEIFPAYLLIFFVLMLMAVKQADVVFKNNV